MTDQGARPYSGPEATSVPRLATGRLSPVLSPLLLRSACPELRTAAGLILSFSTAGACPEMGSSLESQVSTLA